MDWLIKIHLSDDEADVQEVYRQIENLMHRLGEVGTLNLVGTSLTKVEDDECR